MKILVTRKLYATQKEKIESYGYDVIYNYDNSVAIEELEDVEIILGTLKPELLQYTPNLKWMQLPMAGSDTYAALPTVKDRIILTNSTGAFSDSISEWIIGMILYFYKRFNEYFQQQKDHVYYNVGEVRSILGSHILIIGCGSIGMTTARKLNALGAHVTGVKRTAASCPQFLEGLYTSEKVDELLPKADITILAMPQNEETRHFMDDKRLALLKQDSLLVNVGRGSAIDTAALLPYLQAKKIYACLDVHEQEPLSADSPLWDEENCLVLPHVTGNETLAYTREVLVDIAMENLDAYCNKRPMKNVVDFSTGYKISNS